jgi:hypothetical protein
MDHDRDGDKEKPMEDIPEGASTLDVEVETALPRLQPSLYEKRYIATDHYNKTIACLLTSSPSRFRPILTAPILLHPSFPARSTQS